MGHEHHWHERFRKWLYPKLGEVSGYLGKLTGDEYYKVSHQRRNKLVERIEISEK